MAQNELCEQQREFRFLGLDFQGILNIFERAVLILSPSRLSLLPLRAFKTLIILFLCSFSFVITCNSFYYLLLLYVFTSIFSYLPSPLFFIALSAVKSLPNYFVIVFSPVSTCHLFSSPFFNCMFLLFITLLPSTLSIVLSSAWAAPSSSLPPSL